MCLLKVDDHIGEKKKHEKGLSRVDESDDVEHILVSHHGPIKALQESLEVVAH